MEIREQARKDYEAGVSPSEIAAKYDLKPDTVRKWANRHWKKDTGQDKARDKKTGQRDRKKKPPKLRVKTGIGGNGNLVPLNQRTKDEQRAIQSIGGIASGESRREKRRAKEMMESILSSRADRETTQRLIVAGHPEGDVTLALSMRQNLFDLAMGRGMTALQAIKYIDEIMGDNPKLMLKEREIAAKEAAVSVQAVNITPSMEQYAAFRMAENYLWEFCKLRVPRVYTAEAHYLRECCQALQDFETDDTELLVFELPPRHGKSLTVRHAAQWYLGRNPNLRLVGASYNQKLARKLSKGIRNDIGELKASEKRPVFSDVFPNVKLKHGSSQVDLWQLDGSEQENYLATSPKSTATGFGGEIVIIDDIIKNAYEANHRGILEDHFEWFTDTLYSRLEGRSKVILVMTRWATRDLIGRVVAMYREQGRKIRIITKKAFDGKKMLNPSLLDKIKYDNLIRTIGEEIVRANYDQEPIDLKGRLYSEFKTYSETEKPQFKAVYAICDIADDGDDYLCNGIYGVPYGSDPSAYMLDVLYTRESMDSTEDKIIQQLLDYNVTEMRFEKNFGGRAWKKVLEDKYRKAGGTKCQFIVYSQARNKEAKILATSSTVTRKVIMPEAWDRWWPKFFIDVTEFLRTGKNSHDDAQDMLSELVLRGLKITTDVAGLVRR